MGTPDDADDEPRQRRRRHVKSTLTPSTANTGTGPDSVGKTASSTSAVMIWTTEPPVLSPTHPLRSFFTAYGRAAARHPALTLLVSVALAIILIYPLPFLYTSNSFANGSSNLPRHVWTAAQPFNGGPDTPPDVVMRSVWIHGSHMRALERDVLLGALDVQDELLGPTMNFNPRREPDRLKTWVPSEELSIEMRDSMHAINGLGNNSWFFHSPLLYWSCSRKAILEDDIIATVNAQSRRVTSVNVTLRHSIVFSGKSFENRRLVAADALVITLLHKLGSPVGREWERRAAELAARQDGKWRFYPRDGRIAASQLYEFRFQPLSFQDDILLGTAYVFAAAYSLISLRKVRAMKSRIGLAVTVVSQIAMSIMASFTICAVLKIDLSKIPREAYPLVVLTIGLENMFRLTNAVIVASPRPTVSRIGEAVGQTSYIALAGVAQNLCILWLLYKVVSPGVAAFCVFAGIALALDFLLLLTYFVSVLSVDVRRMELGDLLDRSRQSVEVGSNRDRSHLQTWGDALLRGELPISTRIAGTTVMICLVLLAQWHFFDNQRLMRTILRFLRLASADDEPLPLSVDVNQARTPTAWLRLQDRETAREVIQVVKPNSYGYIARVYNPLVLVLEGSDRTPSPGGIRFFHPAAYDFVRNHSMKFVLSVTFAIAAISLLMNYLLWEEDEMFEGQDDDRSDDDPLLGVKTLGQQHSLDISKIATCPEGVIVSVGLDRRIFVWDIRHDANSHLVHTHGPAVIPFPVLEIAIDSSAEWLALFSASGQVMLWSITKRYWGHLAQTETKGKPNIIYFSFGLKQDDSVPPLIMVRSSGFMTEMIFGFERATQISEFQISASPIICAHQYSHKSLSTTPSGIRMLAVSRSGSIYVVSRTGSGWVSENLDLSWPDGDREALSVLPLPQLQALLAIRRQAVDLIDLETRTILHTFPSIYSQPRSVRCFYTVRQLPPRGSTGMDSFSLIYDERESGTCILRTYTSEHESNTTTFVGVKISSQEESFLSWDRAVEHVLRVESPGRWVSLATGIVVGVKKREVSPPSSPDSTLCEPGFSMSGLRQRIRPSRQSSGSAAPEEDDVWEAWMLSAKGESLTKSLYAPDGGRPGAVSRHLLVADCGPITPVGQRSIAVGLGNIIKLITIGNEKFVDESASGIGPVLAGRRRRPEKRKP